MSMFARHLQKTQRQTPTSNPSGQAMPTASLPHWQFSYGNDFSTNAALGQFSSVYGANWAGYTGTNNDTSHNGSYQPNKVLSVSNSCLDMYIHYENGMYCVCAPFPQPPAGVNGGSQEYLYMRTAIRFKSTVPMPGYKTAWLYWPSSFSWNDGEIDFPEGSLDGTIHGFSHEAGTGSPANNALAVGSNTNYYDAWHTAVTEWSPGKVEFILDGVSLGSTTQHVPTKAMHWTLQTETELTSTPPLTSTSGHILIDWLAVWQYV